MKIYSLTPLGKKLARSTHNPDNAAWRVVHCLDGTGYGTPDQIASYTGLSSGEIAGALGMLRRKRIVQEVAGQGGEY